MLFLLAISTPANSMIQRILFLDYYKFIFRNDEFTLAYLVCIASRYGVYDYSGNRYQRTATVTRNRVAYLINK